MDLSELKYYWGYYLIGTIKEEGLIEKTGFKPNELKRHILEEELKELGYDKEIYKRRKQHINLWSLTVNDCDKMTIYEVKSRTGMFPEEIRKWINEVDKRLIRLGFDTNHAEFI